MYKLKEFVLHQGDTRILDIVVVVEGNTGQEVAEVVDWKRIERKIMYLIRFECNTPEDEVWMQKTELKSCMSLFLEFDKEWKKNWSVNVGVDVVIDFKNGVSVREWSISLLYDYVSTSTLM